MIYTCVDLLIDRPRQGLSAQEEKVRRDAPWSAANTGSGAGAVLDLGLTRV